jgi:glycosyltransferase involved in cell wall biosynthesis
LKSGLTIVIPCFNESKSLPILLEKCLKLISNKQIYVVIVNNGSADDSFKILEKYIDIDSNLTIVNIEKNLGYGHGILKGLEKTNTQYVGWTHADLQTDIFDLEVAFNQLDHLSNLTYIKGLRKSRPFSDNIFTLGMSLYETVMFKTFLWDINAQPTILPRTEYLSWVDPPLDFSLDLFSYVQAKSKRLKISRIDVEFLSRKFGESSWNTSLKAKVKFIKRTLIYSKKLKRDLDVKN